MGWTATANSLKAPTAPVEGFAARLAPARGRAARIRGASRLAPLAAVLTSAVFPERPAPFSPTRFGWSDSLRGRD